ncbi:DNA-binding transcriptional activator of the SARP family [Streptoalloteichus tenebrarius]|uniref:DNA-binding transcriptional activator of the SARP family n=1 Tax=Streptoalloteichus tenebrarius (strain ATCC 17920 / DSM 40477 / JCM 4838 / CBS 697.72 / NBRC 16177 / NCIMB 11028 / NRRL B-12390 / A12253. 1 / ISP 5477) TaxID=1933 RepID=A0ABT1I496_STRSD|nr:AfsR/SARP family transcriptional regulator [Streptoalloteichus tenebrarius]MCP2262592.1 DNA-binding transcriptional activator of the SARP family [Streptoalloteichus tenebrarius]BFF02987.1 AfsR/SARP family transcriptional regulator [Streptoalloteichus tenebrarius]
MEFGVLGPLLMRENGVSYLPTAPKQRQLVALLLLNANRLVATDACMEELWGTHPPRSSVQTLQTYILQIRRALAASPTVGSLDAARRILVTGSRGYVLVVDPHSFDLFHFERWVAQGRSAQRDGDDRRVSHLFREALAVWRGPALMDVHIGQRLHTHLVGLEESRLCTLEQCFEAELRLGRHHELLSELSALASQHPVHENLQAQYMLALYRSGRQAQALAVFRQLRRTLAEELGLEPSQRIRRLHEAMLAVDPVLDVDAPSAPRLSLDLASIG